MPRKRSAHAEARRLAEDAERTLNWTRWGPYLSERQWATVREDYSAEGRVWEYFPHDHARSRAYRWGEDGLLGITDRECRLCFALALWNGRDPILKERLFGLTGLEGNHGEDVKEEYFYLEATPTFSYLKALYLYPQAAFPYDRLVAENQRRGPQLPEFELADTGVFEGGRYFAVLVEYAKLTPNHLLIRVTVTNRGPVAAPLHVLPTLWFRNTWSWGGPLEGQPPKPRLDQDGDRRLIAEHESLGRFVLEIGPGPDGQSPPVLFTENETNCARLFGTPNAGPFVKDAFHERVIRGRVDAVNPDRHGTKAAPHYVLDLPAGGERVLSFRLYSVNEPARETDPESFDQVFADRQREAGEFHASVVPPGALPAERKVIVQGYAGLLWSKQFYHYVVEEWLKSDPGTSTPARRQGRNREWGHLHSRDVLSMPDKWEYPWFAAWDLAFHMVPLARIEPAFAKRQLVLLLREWYMHPNGQIPAYEFAFGDVNPPVHAWAAWRVYKVAAGAGARDRDFLESVFQKLLINFTWWVNRKDAQGRNLFSGGFLGLDNIGVFDRSQALPMGGTLHQADGTAWMAFYCLTMLSIALELARDGGKVRTAYEDMASKFFEHFIQISDAMNTLGGTGLWDEADGVYYDQLQFDGQVVPLKTRSLVSLLPLIAVAVVEENTLRALPGFRKRLEWFLQNRRDLARQITCGDRNCGDRQHRLLLAVPSRVRLTRLLQYLFDEDEFLSPYGVRSLSKHHGAHPFVFRLGGQEHRIGYVPGEATGRMFGGNSNWRGPVWFPLNYLLIEALERYHHFYGDSFPVTCPTRSGQTLSLLQASREIAARLTRIFLPDDSGHCPWQGAKGGFRQDPEWRDLVLFHEYFHAETGRGLGASHQTGWTALVIRLLEDQARRRA